MSTSRVSSSSSQNTYILVTGANRYAILAPGFHDRTDTATSGLGLATCCRILDQVIDYDLPNHQLTLIFTTRDDKKGTATLKTLKRHLSNHPLIRPKLPISNPPVFFRPETLELTSLLSVRALTQRLLRSAIPRLDAIILNAGVGGFVALNWPQAFWTTGIDLVEAATWPTYKLSAIGLITQPQLPLSTAESNDEESILGELFCANIFGHYMLVHWLMALLRACPHSRPARIIWLSSIECQVHHFRADDLQALSSRNAYEHTKRLADLMALTSRNQPSTTKSVQSFLALETDDRRLHNNSTPSNPTIQVSHPGICATSIVPLPWLLHILMLLAFYTARLIGSPWHTVSAYTGAIAPVWLALANPDEIAEREKAGAAKWGSAVTRSGQESVQRTDVPGWGLVGDGEKVEWWQVGRGWLGGWGRKRGAVDATREDVEKFVEEGAFVWRELEKLRREWEGRIELFENLENRSY